MAPDAIDGGNPSSSVEYGLAGNPFSIDDALLNRTNKIQPGNVVWLRGVDGSGAPMPYALAADPAAGPNDPLFASADERGLPPECREAAFCSMLQGTPAARIVVCSKPDEWAVLVDPRGIALYDDRTKQTNAFPSLGGAESALAIAAPRVTTINDLEPAWVDFRELEVTNSSGDRFDTTGRFDIDGDGDLDDACSLPPGVRVRARGVRVVDIVVHDTGGGFFLERGAGGAELIGSIAYDNGWTAPEVTPGRGRGHGAYIQSDDAWGFDPNVRLDNNVFVNSFGFGAQAFGNANGGEDLVLSRNVFGNNGSASAPLSGVNSQGQPIEIDLNPGLAVAVEGIGHDVNGTPDLVDGLPGKSVVLADNLGMSATRFAEDFFPRKNVLRLGSELASCDDTELDPSCSMPGVQGAPHEDLAVAGNYLVGVTRFGADWMPRSITGNLVYGGDGSGLSPVGPCATRRFPVVDFVGCDAVSVCSDPTVDTPDVLAPFTQADWDGFAATYGSTNTLHLLLSPPGCSANASVGAPASNYVRFFRNEVDVDSTGRNVERRAHVAAFKWTPEPLALRSSDTTPTGAPLASPDPTLDNVLVPNEPYFVFDAQNYAGKPVLCGTSWTPGTELIVPMRSLKPAQPIRRVAQCFPFCPPEPRSIDDTELLAPEMATLVIEGGERIRARRGYDLTADSDGDTVPDACDQCQGGDDRIRCDELDLDGNPAPHNGEIADCLPRPGDCFATDRDRDGVPDDEDLCQSVADPTNANTNELSEAQHDQCPADLAGPNEVCPSGPEPGLQPAQPKGDACEPVPPPAFRVLPSPRCDPQGNCEPVQRYDLLEVTPVRSNHERFGEPSVVPSAPITTSFRYCQQQTDPGVGPRCDTGDAVEDDRLDDDDTQPGAPYKRLTIGVPDPLPRGASRDYTYDNPIGGVTFFTRDVVTWHFDADRDFWSTPGPNGEPPPISSLFPRPGVPSGLVGTLWLNANTCIGSSAGARCAAVPTSERDVGTGIHGEELANAHVPVVADKVVFDPFALDVGVIDQIFRLPPIRVTPRPEPDPFRTIEVFPCGFDDTPCGESRYLVGSARLSPTVLADDNLGFDATGRIDAEVLAALATPGARWVSAAEPAGLAAMGNPAIGVVLNDDGSSVLATVVQDSMGRLVSFDAMQDPDCGAGTVLVECAGSVRRCSVPCNESVGDDEGSGSDTTCMLVSDPAHNDESVCSFNGSFCSAGTIACPPSTCAIPCDGLETDCAPVIPEESAATCRGGLGSGGVPAAALASGAAPALMPFSCSGFVPVYSRGLRRLFLVGGRDASGAATGDVWVSTASGVSRLALDVTLGRVLAATYTFRDGSLWVLDEVGEPRPHRGHGHGHGALHRFFKRGLVARLIRIDARRGDATVVGEFRRRKLDAFLERVWLVSDRDGHLLVAGTRRLARRHTLVRVDVDTLAVTDVVRRRGEILLQPLVDERGVGLYLRKRGRRATIDRLAPPDLDDGAGPWLLDRVQEAL